MNTGPALELNTSKEILVLPVNIPVEV
jgi:hypothetical protein